MRGICEGALLSLGALRRGSLQLSAEDAIPESTGNTETVLEVSVVVLKVVLLELLVVHGEARRC